MRLPSEISKIKGFYFFYFATIGITEPYLNLYWRHLGFSGSEIGILSSIIPAAGIIFPWLWGMIADVTGGKAKLLFIDTLLAGLCFAVLYFIPTFFLFFLGVSLFSFFKSPLVPFVNSITFDKIDGQREIFGKIRLWGSVGYIFTAIGAGYFLGKSGDVSIFVIGTASFLFSSAIALFIRSDEKKDLVQKAGKDIKKELLNLFKLKPFIIFLTATFFLRLSGGGHTAFFSIYLDELHISPEITGYCWGIGVLVEVIIMSYSDLLLKKVGVRKVLIISFLTASVRWYLYSIAESGTAMILISTLHGITFGAFYLAAMHFLDSVVPSSIRTTGQGVFASLVFGLGGIFAINLAGVFYDKIGMRFVFQGGSCIALFAFFILLLLKKKDIKEA